MPEEIYESREASGPPAAVIFDRIHELSQEAVQECVESERRLMEELRSTDSDLYAGVLSALSDRVRALTNVVSQVQREVTSGQPERAGSYLNDRDEFDDHPLSSIAPHFMPSSVAERRQRLAGANKAT